MTKIKQGDFEGAGEGYRCPACRKMLNAWTNTQPIPGRALSICAYCSVGLRLLENGYGLLTESDFKALPKEAQTGLLRAGMAAAHFRQSNGMQSIFEDEGEEFDPIMAKN